MAMKPSAPAWLDRELAAWEAEGLVTPDQVRVIRARYSAPAAATEGTVSSPGGGGAAAVPGKPWGVILFGGFGAVLLGLGVILLFAKSIAELNNDWMNRFRFVYRAPEPAAVRGLPNAALVWQGELATRAFWNGGMD